MTVHAIPLKLLTRPYHWVLEKQKGTGTIRFYTAAKGRHDITTVALNDYQRKLGTWQNFDDFRECYYGTWMVTVPVSDDEEFSCTCPAYTKHCICKHVLGLKIRQKSICVPNEAKQIPLGQKRKRGRPTMAKRALLVQ